jgi:hypothetical protein
MKRQWKESRAGFQEATRAVVERRGRGCGRWGCLDIIKRGMRDISAKELETSVTIRLGIPGKGNES